jgi:cathepsin D
LTVSGPIYQDVIGLDQTNLTVKNQYLGEVTKPKSPPTFPHDGLIGFAGEDSSSLRESPWFHSLCSQKSLASCRFGMALGTDGTGQMTYGSVDTSAFDGALTTTAIQGEWTVTGDIAVNGKVVQSDARIATDSGTTVIFGPIDSVRAMFKAAGITAVENPGNGNTPTTLDGYYDCSKPPQLGFGFPSAGQAAHSKNKAVSASSSIFNVLPQVLAQKNNNGNCTAIIHGTDEFQGMWLVGQAFFQGHYIDHNVDAGTMGFATLKA